MEICYKSLYQTILRVQFMIYYYNTVAYETPCFKAIQSASKKEIAMCLCKMHLHMRRAVDTLVKRCDKQKIVIDFDD